MSGKRAMWRAENHENEATGAGADEMPFVSGEAPSVSSEAPSVSSECAARSPASWGIRLSNCWDVCLYG
jgi:hypothetical protein